MTKPALRLERLEDVSAPAVFTAAIDPAADNAGAVAELVGFVTAANANAEPDTITLLPGRTYTFTAAADGQDGGQRVAAFQVGHRKTAIGRSHPLPCAGKRHRGGRMAFGRTPTAFARPGMWFSILRPERCLRHLRPECSHPARCG